MPFAREVGYGVAFGRPHVQVITVTGIGAATAAVLVAKIVDIDRFATPAKLVNYFGVFPEENSSGVDKQGHSLPTGTLHMCRKGNDLVRGYLWNATRAAIRATTPPSAPCTTASGPRANGGDIAIGHCMRKLLHLVFAVWKTDRPFDPKHFPWEAPGDAPSSTTTPRDPGTCATPSANDTAVGHKQDLPAKEVVTTAASTVEPMRPPVKPSTPPASVVRPKVDFAFLREHVTMEQVLQYLDLMPKLRGRGEQRCGPCPVHSHAGDAERTFSVHLGKNAFQCFHADCAVKGNVLDLWAAIHRLPLYEAALHLAETFRLPRNREEEPVARTRRPREAAAAQGPATPPSGAKGSR